MQYNLTSCGKQDQQEIIFKKFKFKKSAIIANPIILKISKIKKIIFKGNILIINKIISKVITKTIYTK